MYDRAKQTPIIMPHIYRPTYWAGISEGTVAAGVWRQHWDTCIPTVNKWYPAGGYYGGGGCVVADVINEQRWRTADCGQRHSTVCAKQLGEDGCIMAFDVTTVQ